MSHAFHGEDLSGRDFSQQDLNGALFEGCILTGTKFRSADLSEATFRQCRAFPAAVPEDPAAAERTADFAYANLREALFENCDLTTASFSHASAYDLCFDNCQLQGADLSGCDFALPITRGVRSASGLVSFRMNGCNFAYGDLSNTCLRDCVLTDNRMIEALLTNCVLAGADLSGSDLNGITGTGLDLSGADLRGTTFNTLDPRLMSLAGVRMGLTQGLQILAALEILIDPEAD